ncbi:hypothetical protein OHV05_35535 (plasmid) [Kitasatospora sp. NBC_00070]|uniref:hypothetical protein n=1 Tax=Kitasatospora sp. NBC_00070 TaxID=2975962 RepID=UPI002F914E09
MTTGDLGTADHNGTLFKVAPDGTKTVIRSGIQSPIDVTYGWDGNIYVYTYYDDVLKLMPNGTLNTVTKGHNGNEGYTSMDAALLIPSDIDVDEAGNIYLYRPTIASYSGVDRPALIVKRAKTGNGYADAQRAVAHNRNIDTGMTVSRTGDVYFSSGEKIMKVTSWGQPYDPPGDTESVRWSYSNDGVVAEYSNLPAVRDLTTDYDGNVYTAHTFLEGTSVDVIPVGDPQHPKNVYHRATDTTIDMPWVLGLAVPRAKLLEKPTLQVFDKWGSGNTSKVVIGAASAGDAPTAYHVQVINSNGAVTAEQESESGAIILNNVPNGQYTVRATVLNAVGSSEATVITRTFDHSIGTLWPDGYTMPSGQAFASGTSISVGTVNSHHTMVMQTDGNLAIYDNDTDPVWSSNTWGNPGATATFGADGNLVVKKADGTPIKRTYGGQAGSALTFTANGELKITNTKWSTNTSAPMYLDPASLPNYQAGGIAPGTTLATNTLYYMGSNGPGNNMAALKMQGDGNLLAYAVNTDGTLGNLFWSSNTWGNNGATTTFDNSGNLVIKKADNTVLKRTYLGNNSGASMTLTTAGLQITKDGVTRWSTGTGSALADNIPNYQATGTPAKASA